MHTESLSQEIIIEPIQTEPLHTEYVEKVHIPWKYYTIQIIIGVAVLALTIFSLAFFTLKNTEP